MQEVRREDGFEPWPRLFDLEVDFPEDEVVDLRLEGRGRVSDFGRPESMSVGLGDKTESGRTLLGMRR